ncbi:MAG: HAD family hydrolase [Deltaproteobacteria bacterium]|nr:MAG: HAD family hydrolase [Deltaproteobacteria bacterium]
MSQTRTAPDAVFFDLDGTLVDTILDIAAAMNHVLAANGRETHPVKAYPSFVGHGVRELVTRALPAGAEAEVERLVVAFLARYDLHLVDETRPFPGIPRLLGALAARGTRLAVLSNKPDAQTRRVVETLLGEVPFEDVRGQRDGVPAKPDPTAALEMAASMGLEPGRCAFVGDSVVDVETARAAGMPCVAVTWGYAERERLASSGPRTLADDVPALADALGLPWG